MTTTTTVQVGDTQSEIVDLLGESPDPMPGLVADSLDLDIDIDLAEGDDDLGLSATAAPRTADIPDVGELIDLYLEAVEATKHAIVKADAERLREICETGTRLRAEQERLFQIVMQSIPGAVREAAACGQRTAVVMRFAGADKLDEFCFLYMLKGPHNAEHRAEMHAMGARPLLYRLRASLHAAGFGVHHSWQRATNDNSLAITW